MNVNKLKGKVVEKGMNMSLLAKEIGLDRSTLYRKIKNNGSGLTIKDVNAICRALELSNEEAISIFFTCNVA